MRPTSFKLHITPLIATNVSGQSSGTSDGCASSLTLADIRTAVIFKMSSATLILASAMEIRTSVQAYPDRYKTSIMVTQASDGGLGTVSGLCAGGG